MRARGGSYQSQGSTRRCTTIVEAHCNGLVWSGLQFAVCLAYVSWFDGSPPFFRRIEQTGLSLAFLGVFAVSAVRTPSTILLPVFSLLDFQSLFS